MMSGLSRRPATAVSYVLRNTLSRAGTKVPPSARRQIHIQRHSGWPTQTSMLNRSRPTVAQPSKLQWRAPSDLRSLSLGGWFSGAAKRETESPAVADSAVETQAATMNPATSSAGMPVANPASPSTAPSVAEPVLLSDSAPVDTAAPVDIGLPDLSDSIPQIADHVHRGYLQSLGIEYGYFNPAHYVQELLEIVASTGLPWMTSVVVVALILRVGVLPIQIKLSDQAALAEHSNPDPAAFKAKMEEYTRTKDPRLLDAEFLQLQKTMMKTLGLTASMILTQGAFGLGSFWLLRNMASLPVPGLQTGGMAWFTDLTVADPYYLLPAFFAGAVYMTMKHTMRPPRDERSANIQRYMPMVLPVITFGATLWLPALLQFAFLITSVYSGILSYLLLLPGVRALLRMRQFPVRRAPVVTAAPEISSLRMKKWDQAQVPRRPSSSQPQYQAPAKRGPRL